MELVQQLFSNLFPSRCLLCGQTLCRQASDGHVELCPDCIRVLPYNDCCCLACALPLAEEVGRTALCGRCIKKAPAFDYAYSLFRYEEHVIKLVHQLKFTDKLSYAATLGEMLCTMLQAKTSITKHRPDCLLPVPLHDARLRQRGFNQSIEIARILSRELQLPIEYDAVRRQRKTASQTGLNAQQRRKNISGAFRVVTEINRKHVLIIDDVITTGSTVNELARLLKKHKVERVGVLSIARAPLKN